MRLVNPFRVLGSRAEHGDADARARIESVGARGRVRDLVELLPFLPPEAHPLGVEAARAAGAVLSRCSPLDLAWFDRWYRGGYSPRGPARPAWQSVQLGTSSWAEQYPAVVALASFHENGFVREVAVRLLSERSDGSELPYLLLRTNDWVGKVQAAAMAAVSKRVSTAYAAPWLRCLALLDRARAGQRGARGVALYGSRVEDILLGELVRAELEAALTTGDLAVRRIVLRLALRLPEPERRRLLAAAVADVDPVMAQRATEGLLAQATAGSDGEETVRALLSHRLGTVRGLALGALVDRGMAGAHSALERALFDDARSVRELARDALSRGAHPAPDFAAMYRDRLAATTSTVAERARALEGLADVARRDDAPVLRGFFDAPNARLRAAAIAGLGRCAADEHHEELEAALRDPSAAVRGAATPFAKLALGRAFVTQQRRALRESARGRDHA